VLGEVLLLEHLELLLDLGGDRLASVTFNRDELHGRLRIDDPAHHGIVSTPLVDVVRGLVRHRPALLIGEVAEGIVVGIDGHEADALEPGHALGHSTTALSFCIR
jgi:hypothetical protein